MYNESVLTPELVEMLSNIVATMDAQSCGQEYSGELYYGDINEETNFHMSPTSDGSSSTQMSQALFHAPQVYGTRYSSLPSTSASSSVSRSVSNPTTLMLKNIPNTLSREELFSFIQKNVPAGAVNFLYLPIDYKNRLNLDMPLST